jgi:glycine/D-amino acid oxidase-like deaminating enzyme
MAIPDRDVTVIGAGVVGVYCALYLQRESFRVRLIARDEAQGAPGQERNPG